MNGIVYCVYDQYVYDLSMLALLIAGFPHAKSSSLNGAHLSGLAALASKHAENFWY
jgi:hypothetical protein